MLRLSFIITLLASTTASADPELLHVRAHAAKKTSSVTVDGKLDEECWKTATRQTNFTQRFPQDGGKASLETSFPILYGAHAICVDAVGACRLRRTVARHPERSRWPPSPRSGPQVVSTFGVLDSPAVTPGRRLELPPYVSGGFGAEPIEAGDPLNAHVTGRGGLGL